MKAGEKRGNTSLFGKLSAEQLQEPSAFLCQTQSTGFMFVNYDTHVYCFSRLPVDPEVT